MAYRLAQFRKQLKAKKQQVSWNAFDKERLRLQELQHLLFSPKGIGLMRRKKGFDEYYRVVRSLCNEREVLKEKHKHFLASFQAYSAATPLCK